MHSTYIHTVYCMCPFVSSLTVSIEVSKKVAYGDDMNVCMYVCRPLHLKSVTLAGLPVEEVPCIEIHDTRGHVFSSHIGTVCMYVCMT